MQMHSSCLAPSMLGLIIAVMRTFILMWPSGLNPCVSKQCPADGVWRIGRGGSPDRVLKTRLTPSESSAGHGLPPQRALKQCPANGVRRVLWGFVSRHGLLHTVKKFKTQHRNSRRQSHTASFSTPNLNGKLSSEVSAIVPKLAT